MPNLLRTKFLLERRDAPVLDSVPFEYQTDEGEDYRPGHMVYLDKTVWAEMGSPDVVTITVEPGDTLNEED